MGICARSCITAAAAAVQLLIFSVGPSAGVFGKHISSNGSQEPRPVKGRSVEATAATEEFLVVVVDAVAIVVVVGNVVRCRQHTCRRTAAAAVVAVAATSKIAKLLNPKP